MDFYKNGFFLTEKNGNNALSWEHRKHKKLFVPAIKKIKNISEIKIGTEIAFEDFDENDQMQAFFGLENIYEFDFEGKKIFIFDNHNHALFFWYYAFYEGFLEKKSLVYHIDEHADTRHPGGDFSCEKFFSLKRTFEITNFVCNVGNYMLPALENGMVGEIVQIRSEMALDEYLAGKYLENEKNNSSIILNFDVDFFEPRLDFISSEKKKKVIKDILQKANFITICTSPYFIDQKLALEVLQFIFEDKKK